MFQFVVLMKRNALKWTLIIALKAAGVICSRFRGKMRRVQNLLYNARELQCRIMKTKRIRKGHMTKHFSSLPTTQIREIVTSI